MARVQEATFENQFATLIQPRVEYIYVSVADNHPPPSPRYGLAESKGILAVKTQVATKGPRRDSEITLTPT